MANNKAKADHCDDYIHDHNRPKLFRTFILLQRLGSLDRQLLVDYTTLPWEIFATHEGKRVVCCFASRMGWIGIRPLTSYVGSSYTAQVAPSSLSDFSTTP